jgi:hypothetical protein
MSQYRERVQHGVEQYAAGAYREAIGWWEPVYRELGPHKAYRLSFNLARAYEKFLDFTQAAERYESFLAEVDARRKTGEALPPHIVKEEIEALDRLDQLRKTKARIRVNTGSRPVDVQIDDGERRAAGFLLYVRPGTHAIVFWNGKDKLDTKEVVIDAGELSELTPPSPPEEVRVVEPQPLRRVHEVNHPFSRVVLYVGAGVTVASIIVPILTYSHASSVADSYNAATTFDAKTTLYDQYGSARTLAYATLAIPIALGAITGGLTAFYVLGTKERDVIVASPVVAPVPGGATVGAVARF